MDLNASFHFRAAAALAATALCAAAHAVEPSDAFKADCAFRLPTTDIRVKVVAPPPDYDYSKSMAQLTAMHPSPGTMGLTSGTRHLQVKQSGPMWGSATGLACTRPVIEMTVTLSLTVYVAKEFPRGTCTFREIKEHEQRHVRAHQEYAALTARDIEAQMRKAFGNDIYYGPAKELSSSLRRAVEDGWFRHFETAMNGVAAWNAKIDSRAEYERPYIACSGEPDRLIAAARKR